MSTKSKDLQVLLKADATTLALKAEPGGHIRVNAQSFAEAAVLLPGESLVVRWEHGQLVVARQK